MSRHAIALLILSMLLFSCVFLSAEGEENGFCTKTPLADDVVKWLAPQPISCSLGLRAYEQGFLFASSGGVMLLDSGGQGKWITTLKEEYVVCWTSTGNRCILAIDDPVTPHFVGLSCSDGQVLWRTPVKSPCFSFAVVRGGAALLGAGIVSWCIVDSEGKKVMEANDFRLFEDSSQALAAWNDRISAGSVTLRKGYPTVPPVWDEACVSSQVIGGSSSQAPKGRMKANTDYDMEHRSDGSGIAASEKLVAFSFGPRTMFCPASEDEKIWTERLTFSSAVFLGDTLVCGGETVLIYDTKAHSYLKKYEKAEKCRIWPVDDTKCAFTRQGKAVGYVSPDRPLGAEFPLADKVYAATIVGNDLICLTSDSIVTFKIPVKK